MPNLKVQSICKIKNKYRGLMVYLSDKEKTYIKIYFTH